VIPRISKGGRGFRGAQGYYLHDKGAATTERVGFIALVNLPDNPKDTPERNAERAFAIMAWTAAHQAEIKASAGTKATGRALEKPVYTYSLSWHPDDKPDEAHMRAAALSSLKALAMDKCQAVIISHTDTNAPHVHVILNRVDPTTGKAVSASRDHLKLSTWAQAWEQKHGLTVVQDRVRNNALREQEAAKPKAVRKIIKAENLTREEYTRMTAYRSKTASMVKAERSAQQTADRAQLEGACARRESDAKRAIVKAYGTSRDDLTKQIVELQTRMDRKGLFASIVAFKRRLTGELAADRRALQGLQMSRDNLDMRVAERLDAVAKTNARAREALANRHKAEIDRDERYIAWRERQQRSQSSSGLSPKVMRTRADIGARFVPKPERRQSLSVEHGTAAATKAPSLARTRFQEPGEQRDQAEHGGGKRYSRSEGRGSGRKEGRTRDRSGRNRERDRDPDQGLGD